MFYLLSYVPNKEKLMQVQWANYSNINLIEKHLNTMTHKIVGLNAYSKYLYLLVYMQSTRLF